MALQYMPEIVDYLLFFSKELMQLSKKEIRDAVSIRGTNYQSGCLLGHGNL
jgi:hypothetical protein